MSQPWDREPNEPTKWFERFERFRQMGPKRTVLGCVNAERAEGGASQRTNSVPGSWDDAVAKWKWRDRAVAWDDYQRELARKEEQEELTRRRRIHIAQAQLVQGKAVERLQNLDPATLTARDVLAFLAEGVRLELLGRGAPSEITEERRRELPAEQVDDATLARIALEGSQDAATPSDDPQAASQAERSPDGKSEPGNGIPAG